MEKPAPPSLSIDDLYTLTLADGLKVESEGRPLRYRVVKLRETDVNDERLASRMAERVVMIGGAPRLMASDAEFQLALTMRHCEAFVCDGMKLPLAALDLDLFGRLSAHDVGLIEQRVFLITLAAQVRYGAITQEQFDEVVAGKPPAQASTPQHQGQAAAVGKVDPAAQSGPALLADYAGSHTADAPAGTGR